MTQRLLSRQEYADHRKALGLPGTTYNTICRKVREGKITCVNDKIDPEVADAEWAQNSKQEHLPVDQQPTHVGRCEQDDEDEIPSYQESKARIEAIKVVQEQLRLDQMKGELLKASDVYEAVHDIISNLKQNLMMIPQKVAPEVCSLTDVMDVENLLMENFEVALGQLSEHIKRSKLVNDDNND